MEPNLFGYYMAGLIEGDGSIYVPKMERTAKRHKLYPRIEISFHSDDYYLAVQIIKVLESGYITKKTNKNAFVLSVGTKKGLVKLIEIINGKFRTP